MTLFICIIAFIALIWFRIKCLQGGATFRLKVPFDPLKRHMECTGLEMLLIFNIATCFLGILPLLSPHLLALEIICVIAISKAPYSAKLPWPLMIFILFLLWATIGLFYTPMPKYGIRMLLKYIYPLLTAILAMCVVRDKEVSLKSGQLARYVGLVAILRYTYAIPFVPMFIASLLPGIFWNDAAICTNSPVWVIFSLALLYTGIEKRKNLLWAIAFALPPFLNVFRTNIFEIFVGLSAFFFIKYRWKSVPYIAIMGVLGVCSLFYIPSVKKKMYFRPDEVTLHDFLTDNVDENNINTSGRKLGWEQMEEYFYKGHETIGSGTGRVQTWFYEEAEGWQRGGQLHGDLLILKCDNGDIGWGLYILAYISVMFHCMYIYHKSSLASVRLCSLVAGASLIGMLVTLHSDNTVSYSMATLSVPWTFYGMAVGLQRREKELRWG